MWTWWRNWFFWQVGFIKCSLCWFHQQEGRSQNCVMKKYLVLLSNYNVIGRIYLTGVIGLRNGKTRLFFVLWETYSWFWLFSMEPKQDILWLKGCFFIYFPPNKKVLSQPHNIPSIVCLFPISSSFFLKNGNEKVRNLIRFRQPSKSETFRPRPCEAPLCLLHKWWTS